MAQSLPPLAKDWEASIASSEAWLPTLGQDDKTLGAVGTLDDFDSQALDVSESLIQFRAGVAAIGKELCQRWRRVVSVQGIRSSVGFADTENHSPLKSLTLIFGQA